MPDKSVRNNQIKRYIPGKSVRNNQSNVICQISLSEITNQTLYAR